MKRVFLFLLMVASLGILVSCQKDFQKDILNTEQNIASTDNALNPLNQVTTSGSITSGSMDDEVEQFPQAIQDYVDANYPGMMIVEAEAEDEGFEIELSDGTELLFDADGNFLEVEVDDDSSDEVDDDSSDEVDDDSSDEDDDDDDDDEDEVDDDSSDEVDDDSSDEVDDDSSDD